MTAKKIEVRLVIGNDPPVEVDPVVNGRPKREWVKEDGTTEFKFVDIAFIPPGPFSNEQVNDNKIKIDDNVGVVGDYEYVITVRSGDELYTSTREDQAPGGDKPVIRN